MEPQTQTPTASVTPTAAVTTPAPATTPTPAPAAAAPSSVTPPPEEMVPKSQVERMMKDRLKNLGGYKEAYEAMVEAGLIDAGQFVSPTDVVNYIKQSKLQQAQTKAQTGDTTDYAKLVAKNEATSAVLDMRIDVKAAALAEKDPLFADLADQSILEELRPMARLMHGDVKGAYMARYGDKFSERQKAVLEAKFAADLQAKLGKHVESGDSASEAATLGLSIDELQFTKMMGMDPKKYRALKDMDNYGDYEKTFKKK